MFPYFPKTQSDDFSLDKLFHDMYDLKCTYGDISTYVSRKLEEMKENGELAELLNRMTGTRLNLNVLVPTLDTETFPVALEMGLAITPSIYIPDGHYEINEPIYINSKDVDIEMSENACIIANIADAINFRNCKNVHIKGGQWNSGTDVFDGHSLNASTLSSATCNFYQCVNVNVDHVKTLYSHNNSVFIFEFCDYVIVHDSYFKNLTYSALHFLYDGTYIVENNVFENVHMIEQRSDVDYCYFSYTGIRHLNDADQYYLPDKVVYRGNYCKNSPDSALDTHGARSITIADNTLINCRTSITAYDDVNRITAGRRDGDHMKNVVVSGNSVRNENGSSPRSEHYGIMVYGRSGGVCDCNIVIENNNISTNNVNGNGVLNVFNCQKATIRNNILTNVGNNYPVYAYNVGKMLSEANTFENFIRGGLLRGGVNLTSRGDVVATDGTKTHVSYHCDTNYTSNGWSYIDTDCIPYGFTGDYLVKQGDYTPASADGNGRLSTTTGINYRATYTSHNREVGISVIDETELTTSRRCPVGLVIEQSNALFMLTKLVSDCRYEYHTITGTPVTGSSAVRKEKYLVITGQ